MFLAHLPAGYLVARALDRRRARSVLAASLVGSVLPDVDLVWLYVVDGGRVHHHRYWTHVPLFWLAVAALGLPLLSSWRGLGAARMRIGVAFLVAVASHLVLDTLVGDIQWLQPWSDRFVHVVTVAPVVGRPWWWAFVTHWTFAVELAIVTLAAALFVWRRPSTSEGLR